MIPIRAILLRFAVGQYQRGVERHRKALRRSHNTVKLSAKLGTALIVLPMYVAVRASVSVGRKLRAARVGNLLLTLNAQARKLLNFSDFDELVNVSANNVVLNETMVRPVSALARPMFQMLISVGHCLSRFQLKEISEQLGLTEVKKLSSSFARDTAPDKFRLSESGLRRWLKGCRVAAGKLLNFEKAVLADDCGLATAAVSSQIARLRGWQVMLKRDRFC